MKANLLIIVMLVFSTLFVFVPFSNSPVSATDYSAWSYYRQCWVDQTNVDVDLVNFPVMVNISDAMGDKCQASGQDIRFTSSDNNTLYPHNIEKWVNGVNRTVWVRIPRVDDAVNTSFWFHYGNAAATALTNYTDVWDTNYVLVLHFNETAGTTCFDSSSKNHDGTYTNGPVVNQAGRFGIAVYLDGVNDYIDFGDNDDFSPTAQTYFFMLKPGVQFETTSAIFAKESGTDREYSSFCTPVSKVLDYSMKGTGGGYIGRKDANGMTTMGYAWNHWGITWDGTAAEAGIDLFINNTICDDTAYSGGVFTAKKNLATNFLIGTDGYNVNNYNWLGYLEEFRFSGIKRNNSWTKAEYYSMVQTNFIQISGIERSAAPFPITVSGVYPTPGTTNMKTCPVLSLHINHSQGARLNITFYLVIPGEDAFYLSMINKSSTYSFGLKGSDSNLTYYCIFRNGHVEQVYSFDFFKLNYKYYWFVNISDGLGHSRNYPNSSLYGDIHETFRCYNFTTGSVNNTDAITVNDLNLNTSVSHTEEYVNGTGWIVNYTSESQLNLTFNLTHAVETHFAVWNTPFWDIIVNATGNTSGLVVVDNSVNTTGTNQFQWRPLLGVNGEWWVWVNQTGDTTPIHSYQNIVNAAGTHTVIQNGTGYWDWANYTGAAGGGNLTLMNPNPGNGTHQTEATAYGVGGNYQKKDITGLTTSVDVSYVNFKTPPATLPGVYNVTINSTAFSNTPTTWNTSTVYAWVWNNATGGIAPSGPLYVGQLNAAGDYTTFRSFLRFDTSVIPDEAVITSAYVKLIVWQDFSDTDFNVTLLSVKPPKPHNPLIPSDYGRSGIGTISLGQTNTTGYTNDDVFNIALKTLGLNQIDKTFYTNFSVRSHKDQNQTAPGVGTNEWITFYGNGMPIANYPKLIINYTVPSSSWGHIVNLTWYNHTSGLPYYVSHVASNGTITVPAVNFSEAATYNWNVSAESNHTNHIDSSVFTFTTMSNVSSKIIPLGGTGGYVQFLLPMSVAGCLVAMVVRRRKKKNV